MIMKTNETENNQLTVSHELLLLLRWLVSNEEERLKKIVNKALNAGLHQELQKISFTKKELAEEIQYSITDFFNLLEILLIEGINEQVVRNAKENNLMSALDHIDSTICDEITVRSSLEKATNKIAHNPNANPKEILYTELLKFWKPTNKNNIS